MRISLKTVSDNVGGLSQPGKMPFFSYSIPTEFCKVGSKLREIKGSVCYGCYSHNRGNYRFPAVKDALQNRYEKLIKDYDKWVDNLVLLLRGKAKLYTGKGKIPFRFHDAGDLQDVDHLKAINKVAINLEPDNYWFWLPTREYEIVEKFFKDGNKKAYNLNIRLSAHMIDGPVPEKLAKKYGLTVSSVNKNSLYKDAEACKAPNQNNQCKDCRSCWDTNNFHITYKYH